ncbi:MAG: hypothetical protein LBQ80_00415 [Clostridium sp.]|jgi:hypothetical protein|nr:hypothetical protein [Clostridium sp.]
MKPTGNKDKKRRAVMLWVSGALAVAAAAAITLTVIFAGVPPLSVNGFELDDELYRYFVDTVRAAPEDYGLVENSPDSSIIEEANQLAVEYAAVELQFAEKGAVLTAADKSTASKETNNLWRIFGDYYESIGVEKTTLMLVRENVAKSNVLFSLIYETGGSKAVSEKDLLASFNKNYVVFREFSDSFTTTNELGEITAMTDAEKKALRTKFSNMVSQVQSGQSIDEIFSSYYDVNGQSLSDEVLGKNERSGYGDDFFAKVQKITAGSTAVVESGKEIHLVERVAASKDAEYFWSYRLPALKALKGEEYNKAFAEYVATLSVDESSGTQKRLARRVLG